MHCRDKRAKTMSTWDAQVQSHIDVALNSFGSSVVKMEQFVCVDLPVAERCNPDLYLVFVFDRVR